VTDAEPCRECGALIDPVSVVKHANWHLDHDRKLHQIAHDLAATTNAEVEPDNPPASDSP
jgi:hypothetical protein